MKRGTFFITSNARFWQVLAVLLGWLLAGPAWGQAVQPPPQVLAHRVQLTPGTRSLGEVLAELAQQGGVSFSYSSSLVPVAHRHRWRPGPARPLAVVLREVLAAEQLSFGLLGGQLVVWPDRVAAPAGITAINGRPTPPIFAAPISKPTTAAEATQAEAGMGLTAADNHPPRLRALSTVVVPKSAKRTEVLMLSNSASVDGSLVGATHSGLAVRSHARAGSTTQQRRTTRRPLLTPAGKQLAPRRAAPATALASRGRGQARGTSARHVRRPAREEVASSTMPSAARSARRMAAQSPRARPAIDSLPSLAVRPAHGLDMVGRQPIKQLPARTSLAVGQELNQPATDSTAKNSRSAALKRGYLRGEVWGSESLPLNAAVKVGIPRIYFLLSAAVGPFGQQAGAAWGVGMGTVGQPRGRFTPGLDLLYWFVAGDRLAPPNRLAQLRPQLAWQLKPGSRWQLIGGPTLNLATTQGGGGRPRWAFGQDQWLWLNSEKDRNPVRLWPGFQLGVRF